MSSSTLNLPLPTSTTIAPPLPKPVDGPQLSPTPTIDAESQNQEGAVALPSNTRRYFLLFVFSLAQFLDIFGASAVIVGLSQMAKDLDMGVTESVWVVNAYSLTLASTLLTGGRVADITNPKIVFIVGFLFLGLFSMGVGLSKDKITLLVLRAFSGLGASLTIPAATNLIIHLFPEPDKQATAIAIFGGSGAIANIFGLIVGGALLLGGWSWIFYFSTIIATPLALLCIFLIPTPPAHVDAPVSEKDGIEVAPVRKPKMDYVGTFLQTGAIVLLIYGLTEANVKGWRDPATIATVIIGGLLFPAFFYWESRIDPIDALISPQMWRIPNFALLAIFGLSIGYWFFEAQVAFSDRFQGEWAISGIMTAVRFLPSGISATVTMVAAQNIPLKRFPLRYRLISGAVIAALAMLMFSFVDSRSDYWPLIFPGLVLGAGGAAMAFVGAYVALIMSVPAEHSGVAGGLWNSVLQLGAAALLSITSTIQVAFPEFPGQVGPSQHGYKYGFLFAMGLLFVEAGLIIAFFKDPLAMHAASTEDTVVGAGGDGAEDSKKEVESSS